MVYKSEIKSRQGFTIVEILVVVVVIGILAAITIVSYTGVTNSAKQQAALTDAQAAGSALTKYKADHGKYPNAIADVGTIVKVQSDFDYKYEPNADTYCLTATNGKFTAQIRSKSTKAEKGTCPDFVTNVITNPNLVSATNYSGSTGSYPVYQATGTNALMSDGGYSGATYLRRTYSASGPGSVIYGDTTSIPIPGGGGTYTASAWVRGSQPMTINIVWLNSSGTTLSTSTGSSTTVSSSAWTRLSVTGGGPLGSVAAAKMYISNGAAAWASGNTQDIDAVMLNSGSSLYKYADGFSTGWVWNGTPDASTSTGSGFAP